MKLSRFNRILLEDAYPDEIKRRQVDRGKACEYFSEKLEDCIGEIVDPKNAMKKWFQEVAEQIAKKAKRSIRWTAPSGFPIFQETWKLKRDKIDVGVELVLWKKPKKNAVRDAVGQKRKIVANVIHSLDAAHMVLTIGRLHSEGLKHFGVVHDCYAVHACDVDRLRTALREEFVGMYRIPPGGKSRMEKFLDEQKSYVAPKEIKFPDLPPPGNFYIELVLQSEYFFC